MESICTFEPLWANPELIEMSDENLDEIRAWVLGNHLSTTQIVDVERPTLEQLIRRSLDIMASLLAEESPNTILKVIRSVAHRSNMDPMMLVKGAITSWYMSSAPTFSRDPEQGLPPDADLEVDDTGDPVLRWSRIYASEQHYNGSLGLMGVLMASRAWVTPADPKLARVTLVSNTVTTILFASYLILEDSGYETWVDSRATVPGYEAMKLFLRVVWKFARDVAPKTAPSPSVEFGATTGEVKLDASGKTLLTKIGCTAWFPAPYWHPCRQVPGSPWNKFIKNESQPTFSPCSVFPNINFKIPSSALTIITPWEMHYSGLRTRFDQTSRPRLVLSAEESLQQYKSLASKSGHEYPVTNPSEITAEVSHEVSQEYLYIVPMVKKPIADSQGHVTLPFMTTAVRGMRFEEEPDEVEADFFIMSFKE